MSAINQNLIFLIEDEPELRLIERQALEAEGFEVMEAETGVQALEKLAKSEAPILTVCDISMPSMTGPEFLRRALPQHPDLSVVMLTAHEEHENVVECLRLGAIDFLVKPIRIPQLVERIYTLVSIAQMRLQSDSSKDASKLEKLLRAKYSRSSI